MLSGPQPRFNVPCSAPTLLIASLLFSTVSRLDNSSDCLPVQNSPLARDPALWIGVGLGSRRQPPRDPSRAQCLPHPDQSGAAFATASPPSPAVASRDDGFCQCNHGVVLWRASLSIPMVSDILATREMRCHEHCRATWPPLPIVPMDM